MNCHCFEYMFWKKEKQIKLHFLGVCLMLESGEIFFLKIGIFAIVADAALWYNV
ncbi:hypothetical protein DGMP_02210 [Desulfomarina profundi]|uniref:Uncharacterized protein n=1 Tax=Desulfomarina profundi TaxID=2772557 RepID=A0A8D5FIP0_9BACT|nr:hypothetical protein DGMP_02210 [Desulfomarina profundi]